MKAEFSEFSYAMALTSELLHWSGTSLTGAPIFPSTRAEGGLGYDVQLRNVHGMPLFLQFKLTEYIQRERKGTRETEGGYLRSPFYRMHLRSARYSRQHKALLNLERSGNRVFYAAPDFWTQKDFDTEFINEQVSQRSVFFRPASIGSLPDDGEHHVAFQRPGKAFLFSVPRAIHDAFDFDALTRRVAAGLNESGSGATIEDWAETLLADIRQALTGGGSEDSLFDEDTTFLSAVRGRIHPLAEVAYLAQTRLDAQLYVVTQKGTV